MNILEARRRILGGEVIKKTAEGNPISVRSLARMYPGIEMQGWTEQAQYEGKNLFDADKAKQLSSWISTDVYRHFDIQLKPNTTYTLFVSQNNMYKGYKEEYDDNFALYLGESENVANPNESFGNSSVTSKPKTFYTFTTTEVPYYINLFVGSWNEENLQIAFDELLVNMMLVEGSSVVPYEPYTGGNPSPSPDYPQEIVSAGKYDEGTGKYQYTIKISDSEESPTKSQTVTLTSDRPLTKWDRLEKRGGQWGWVYKSEVKSLPKTGFYVSGRANNNGVYYIKELPLSEYDTKIGNAVNHEQYFNFFVNENPYTNVGNYAWLYRVITSSVVQFRIGLQDDSIASVQELEEYLSELGEIIVVYETTEETFVPLSTSEREQMNALYTFRPTTVLSNDAGCEMSLTYKTKKSLEVTT